MTMAFAISSHYDPSTFSMLGAASPRAVTPSFASIKSVSQPANLGRGSVCGFRDMLWASHSESQEILLTASTAACGGKMVWTDAKATGVFLWLNSLETMVRNYSL